MLFFALVLVCILIGIIPITSKEVRISIVYKTTKSIIHILYTQTLMLIHIDKSSSPKFKLQSKIFVEKTKIGKKSGSQAKDKWKREGERDEQLHKQQENIKYKER